MLAQALGDFMLLSALKKGQGNSGNSSAMEPVLPRGERGEDLVAYVYGTPVNIDGLVFLSFLRFLTSQNL